MNTSKPRSMYILALALAVMCVAIGGYLFATVVAGNGWRSHWRIAVAVSVAQSALEVLTAEATSWSE